jgi:error-prone DNA polymerase
MHYKEEHNSRCKPRLTWHRRVIQQAKFIGVEGPIQKEGPIIHVMARSFYELSVESHAGRLKVTSHDFH